MDPRYQTLGAATQAIGTPNGTPGSKAAIVNQRYNDEHPFQLEQPGADGGYAAYTNDKDLVGNVTAKPGERVQLYDPKTGDLLYEGVGPQGAQEVASLANYMAQTSGHRSQYDVVVENGAGSGDFSYMAGDRKDGPRGLARAAPTLLNLAGTVLGSMAGMPMLGAALGGAAGGVAGGGGLKGALLGAISGGAGAGLGGLISSGLQGAVTGLGQGALSSAASGAASSIPGALTSALPGTLGELVVTAPRTLLGGGIGGALGSAAGGALTQAALQNANAAATGGANQVQELVVNGRPTSVAPFNPVTAAGGITGSVLGDFTKDPTFQSTEMAHGQINHDLKPPLFDPQKFAYDTVGDTIGGVAADYGTLGLAKLLGWIPSTQQAAGTTDRGPAVDHFPDAPGSQPSTPQTPTPVQPGTTVGGGTGGTGGAGAGGIGGTGSLMSTGAAGGAGAAAAAPADIKTQGSLAPDIYPWRKIPGRT